MFELHLKKDNLEVRPLGKLSKTLSNADDNTYEIVSWKEPEICESDHTIFINGEPVHKKAGELAHPSCLVIAFLKPGKEEYRIEPVFDRMFFDGDYEKAMDFLKLAHSAMQILNREFSN